MATMIFYHIPSPTAVLNLIFFKLTNSKTQTHLLKKKLYIATVKKQLVSLSLVEVNYKNKYTESKSRLLHSSYIL